MGTGHANPKREAKQRRGGPAEDFGPAEKAAVAGGALRDGINDPAPEAGSSAAGDDTPLRLLDAAERLFAQQGVAGTSVRDITAAAGCNVAAINYHFGGKQQLYQRVFERRLEQLREQRLAAIGQVVGEAEDRHDVSVLLRAFAHAFLRPFVQPHQGPIMVQLMMRELIDPKLPPGTLLNQMVLPIRSAMQDALLRASPGLSPRDALRCLHSLVAQLVHVVQLGQIFAEDAQALVPFDGMQDAIEHVVRFSVAGIRALAEEPLR